MHIIPGLEEAAGRGRRRRAGQRRLLDHSQDLAGQVEAVFASAAGRSRRPPKRYSPGHAGAGYHRRGWPFDPAVELPSWLVPNCPCMPLVKKICVRTRGGIFRETGGVAGRGWAAVAGRPGDGLPRGRGRGPGPGRRSVRPEVGVTVRLATTGLPARVRPAAAPCPRLVRRDGHRRPASSPNRCSARTCRLPPRPGTMNSPRASVVVQAVLRADDVLLEDHQTSGSIFWVTATDLPKQ